MSFSNGAINSNEPQPPMNKPGAVFGITLTFATLSWLCVIFRLYTRIRIIHAPGWDDAFIAFYLLSMTAGTTAIFLATRHGLGEHFWALTPDERTNYLHIFYFANGVYPMSTTFVKLSLLCQYLRIYNQGSIIRHLCVLTIIITSLWGFAFSFMAWFPCFPIEGFWNNTITAKCYGYASPNPDEFSGFYIVHSTTTSIFDLVVLCLSIPLFFRLGTESHTKIGLVILLSVGIIVGFISIWRLETLIEHRAATSPIFDPTWYAPISIILSVLEVDIACICACVPIFWPVLTRSLDQIMVTKEVKITHEFSDRVNFDDCSYELGLGYDPHKLYELDSCQRLGRPHSRHDFVAELEHEDEHAIKIRGLKSLDDSHVQ